MKAVRITRHGGPEVLDLTEVVIPEPGVGEVLLRIESAGVNFVDTYYRSGQYMADLPLILGMEAAGIVDQVGPGVSEISVGDTVAFAMLLGAYGQYIVLPADRCAVVPEGLSASLAAASILQGMTAQFLSSDLNPARAGEPVLVHAAAGGLGQLLVQFLKCRGAVVYGTVSTDAKAAIAAEAGADEVINYAREDFAQAVARLTDGEGVAVCYDSVGASTWQGTFDCVRPRGLVVFCGQASGPVPPIDPQLLRARGSVMMARPSLSHFIADHREFQQRSGEVFTMVRDGELRIRVDSTYPLVEAAAAHRRLESRRATGKILLQPW